MGEFPSFRGSKIGKKTFFVEDIQIYLVYEKSASFFDNFDNWVVLYYMLCGLFTWTIS